MVKVSARSRNQYSVVGESGKAVRAFQVNASRGNPSRFGAAGTTDESDPGAGVSRSALRARFHLAAGIDGCHILSAQSTDKRVNLTTPAVFTRYPTAVAYAQADRAELEELIHPTGFFRNKASSLIGLGQALIERFNGEVPATMAELVTLPGWGARPQRDSGERVRCPGITVDTHFGRLSAGGVGPLKRTRSRWSMRSATDRTPRMDHAEPPGDLPRPQGLPRPQTGLGVCLLAKDCPSFGLGPTEPLLAAALVQGRKPSTCWPWPGSKQR